MEILDYHSSKVCQVDWMLLTIPSSKCAEGCRIIIHDTFLRCILLQHLFLQLLLYEHVLYVCIIFHGDRLGVFLNIVTAQLVLCSRSRAMNMARRLVSRSTFLMCPLILCGVFGVLYDGRVDCASKGRREHLQ
jgi:hypothetical protein